MHGFDLLPVELPRIVMHIDGDIVEPQVFSGREWLEMQQGWFPPWPEFLLRMQATGAWQRGNGLPVCNQVGVYAGLAKKFEGAP
jgi:hypothetical protein